MAEQTPLRYEITFRPQKPGPAAQAAQELSDLRATFIRNVSHEFRTPLGIIQGYAELLHEGELGALAPEQADALSIIVNRTRELRRMVERVGTLMSIEGRASVTVPLNLAEVVERTVAEKHATAAEEAGLTLTLRIAPNLPLISGDPYQLEQAVDSLIENAIKFTPDGGEVGVEAYAEPGRLCVTVSDTGIGIPEEGLSRIFTGFYQVDGSTTRQYGGIGLGLTLVKAVVETHRGEVVVQSEPGKGSRFTLKLPVMPPEAQGEPSMETQPKVQTILVVDDEAFVVMTLQAALEKLPNCEVLTAYNGQQALDVLRERPVHLLITDYRMPDMDGMELAARVREEYPCTSVVVITAYNSDTLREQAARASVRQILDKPVKISEIRTIASAALEESS